MIENEFINFYLFVLYETMNLQNWRFCKCKVMKNEFKKNMAILCYFATHCKNSNALDSTFVSFKGSLMKTFNCNCLKWSNFLLSSANYLTKKNSFKKLFAKDIPRRSNLKNFWVKYRLWNELDVIKILFAFWVHVKLTRA